MLFFCHEDEADEAVGTVFELLVLTIDSSPDSRLTEADALESPLLSRRDAAAPRTLLDTGLKSVLRGGPFNSCPLAFEVETGVVRPNRGLRRL